MDAGRSLYSPEYVRKSYHTGFMLRFVGLALLGALALSAVFYFSLDIKLSGGYTDVLDGMRFIRSNAARTTLMASALGMLVSGGGVAVLTMLISHRLAGPAWRFEQTARAVSAGDLSVSVKLRDDDEAKELALHINEMVSETRYKVAELKSLGAEMDAFAEGLYKPGLRCDEAMAIVHDVVHTCSLLRERLEDIKVE